MTSENIEIAIIGAGVIGLTLALRLASDGHEVMLIDPNEPGMGASYGNAGTFAEYACIPIGTPEILRSLPRLLLNPESPFALRRAALLQIAPWLLRFFGQSFPSAARDNAMVLAGLLADALPAWREVAAEVDAEDLLRSNGCLYIFRNKDDFDAAAWSRTLRSEAGAQQEILFPGDVAALEPSLGSTNAHGLYFPNSMNVSDPLALMKRILASATKKGATIRKARVDSIDLNGTSIIVRGSGFSIGAHRVVVAAGAHSRPLAAQTGDNILLETERGYHLEFATDASLLSRPVCPVDLGFYMTPLQGRLRVAGTVELGGLDAPANPKRYALLDRGVRQFFPDLPSPSSTWMGFRPSLPDSRPVIGRSRKSPNVFYAFGHGHIGLTLGAVTARIAATAIAGRIDLPAAFRADRPGIKPLM